eukprot:954269-Pyramimonas_sp.AAC.1
MRGSMTNPPPWSPEMEQQYPFRSWLADVVACCSATNVGDIRKGPHIELCQGGIARYMIRELPLQAKIHGAEIDLEDGAGPQRLNGAAFILQALARQFLPLEEETNLRGMTDQYGFARLPGENIDTMLTRWE